MGLLKFLHRPAGASGELPSGSCTVDRNGRVLSQTVPSTFTAEWLGQIARLVLEAFRSGEAAQFPARELVVEFEAITLRAREMRGGAILFFLPRKTA
jgi:hypothetical protein